MFNRFQLIAAQLTFVLRNALNCCHKIAFSGNTPPGSASVISSAIVRTYCKAVRLGYVRDLQVESNATLLRTLQVPGTA